MLDFPRRPHPLSTDSNSLSLADSLSLVLPSKGCRVGCTGHPVYVVRPPPELSCSEYAAAISKHIADLTYRELFATAEESKVYTQGELLPKSHSLQPKP